MPVHSTELDCMLRGLTIEFRPQQHGHLLATCNQPDFCPLSWGIEFP
jgi:hypothetical protein